MDPEALCKTASTSNLVAADGVARDALAAKFKVPTKATRRIRGEIACAECRRLKIRCDRIVPCSTCIKRGCASLCPNGTIPPGEGSRFVLAATDHLRNKLTRMEARMRSLEDGLAIIQSSESDQPHPLLSAPFELEEDEVELLKPVPEEKETTSAPPLRDASGTLWLDGNGASRFFGPSGGTESLLMTSNFNSGEKPETQNCAPVLQELDPSYLSSEINQCYQAFPLTPPNIVPSSVLATVESFLPAMDRAIILCDTFLEHLSWMFNIVSRQTLVHELIPMVYKQTPVSYGPHELALLLVVLGIGSLVDLNLPPYDLEAQHYYRLTRATMVLQPVLGAQSMVTIKVLHLMSIYNGMSGKESNLEQTYVLLELAGQIALRIGFHIDPSMWGFSGREAYDRRVYFWNLVAGTLWQSIGTGRPPSLLMSFIDCRIPSAEDENTYQQGEVPLGFGIWGFRASAECLIPMTRAALAIKPPKYEAIMELDRKIREFAAPRGDGVHNPDRTSVSMRNFVRSHYRALMLLHLHRAYFAQAMTEYPDDPIGSPYGKSVVAAYEGACVVLDHTRAQFLKKPLLCARIWQIWTFTFTATVVVGTVAIGGVHLDLKPSALQEFESIYDVFVSAAQTSNRAARALPVLRVMLQKSREAHQYYQERGTPLPPSAQTIDELLHFANMSGVIQRTPTSGPTPSNSHSPDPPPSTLASTTHHINSTTSPTIRPTPLAVPLLSSSSDDLYRSIHSPLDAPGNSAAPPPMMRVPVPRTSPSSQQDLHPPPQLKIPSLPRMDPYSVPHYRTVADITGEWGGLFHDGPVHHGGGHAPNTNLNRRTGQHMSRTGFLSDAYATQPPATQNASIGQGPRGLAGAAEGVMPDDRWTFIDYDLMMRREPSQYRHP